MLTNHVPLINTLTVAMESKIREGLVGFLWLSGFPGRWDEESKSKQQLFPGKHKSPSINQQLGCICNLCFDENKYFMFGCHAVVALEEVTYFWQELLIIGSDGPMMPW